MAASYQGVGIDVDPESGDWTLGVHPLLKIIARQWDSHPDFREEWR